MLPDLDQLLKMYPLRVYFPRLGAFLLLIIHSESEQQEMLLARNEERLLAMYKAQIRKNGWPKTVRELWKVTTVQPPLWLRKSFAEDSYKSELYQFQGALSYCLKDYHPLPSFVTRCKFEPDPDYYEENKPSPEDKKEHYGCKNCQHHGFIFDEEKTGDIFLAKRHLIEKMNKVGHVDWLRGRKRPVQPHPIDYPTDVRDPTPNEPLYAVLANHGHHAEGNVIKKVEDGNTCGLNALLNPYPLFFFHDTKEKLPDWAKKIPAEFSAQRKKEAMINRKRSEEESKRVEQERLKVLKEILS